MSYNEIHKRIQQILLRKMRIPQVSPVYTANFYDDFGLSQWELNWLLYHIEDQFKIDLENGLEEKLSTVNQLVAIVHKEQRRQYAMQPLTA